MFLQTRSGNHSVETQKSVSVMGFMGFMGFNGNTEICLCELCEEKKTVYMLLSR